MLAQVCPLRADANALPPSPTPHPPPPPPPPPLLSMTLHLALSCSRPSSPSPCAAAVAAEADRVPDPSRTTGAPVDVAEAVAARMRTQLPKRITHTKIVTSLTTAAYEAMV